MVDSGGDAKAGVCSVPRLAAVQRAVDNGGRAAPAANALACCTHREEVKARVLELLVRCMVVLAGQHAARQRAVGQQRHVVAPGGGATQVAALGEGVMAQRQRNG